MADDALTEEELREQLADVEAQYHEVHQKLTTSQLQLQEARRCGGLLLSAAEAALAPLMLELARAREATDLLLPPNLAKDEVQEPPEVEHMSSREAIETEIRHLKLDIDHFKNLAARLQTEDMCATRFHRMQRRTCAWQVAEDPQGPSPRTLSADLQDAQRFYILQALRNELQEATEELGYQRDRARHHEVLLPGGTEELARSARTSRLDRSAAFFFWDPERSKAWALKGMMGERPRRRRGAEFAVVKRHRNLLLVPFRGGTGAEGRVKGPAKKVSRDQLNGFGGNVDYEAGTEAHLELLLSAGARVASLNRRRQAPLHLCTTKAQVLRLLAARGELELKDESTGRGSWELLKQRASLQLRNRRAESALQLAARKGHLKIAELLLDAQIDVNTTDKDGTSPLCVALTGGFQDFAALLLAHQADADLPDSRGRNVFCVAAENDRLKVLQLLLPVLPADAAPLLRRDIFGRTALYAAAERGHAEAVELLLAAKSEVQVLDHNHRSLLHAAALAHSSHCLEQLLDARVAVDVADREGRTALHVAAEGEEELVEGRTALHLAAWQGDEEVVEVLLEARADTNHPDSHCHAPLHLAADQGHLEVVRSLIQNQADGNQPNIHGRSPLHAAANQGHLEICHLLVDAKALVSLEDRYCDTPLKSACVSGHADVAQALAKVRSADS
eukprot:g6609.t1